MKKFPLLKAVFAGAVLAASLPASAIFTNGGFESGDFTGWTSGFGSNGGLQGAQPFTGASILINAGGSFRGAVVTGGPDLLGAPIQLPYAGTATARVNNEQTGGFLNFISQSDAVTEADRDPADSQLHIRFNYAVVLEDPGHSPAEQPFFFLRVRNVTKGTTLYEDFSFAGQTGTQFVPVPTPTGGNNPVYLDWKPADVVVPNADLGDTIEVYLLASDCEPTGHSGYAYLDGFGSRVVPPGGGARGGRADAERGRFHGPGPSAGGCRRHLAAAPPQLTSAGSATAPQTLPWEGFVFLSKS